MFCFPDRYMGPDIVFLVECGNQVVWVLVQTKCLSLDKLSPAQTKQALKSTSPSKLYVNKHGEIYSSKSRPLLLPVMRKAMDISSLPVMQLLVSYPAAENESVMQKKGSLQEVFASFKDLPRDEGFRHTLKILKNVMLG
ncbi:hypothetical protein BKA93DRAFT_558396 [Sparassis latifolia]